MTVGVLSDSVNQFAAAWPTRSTTGDLPANVNVLQDGPAGSTDEGRAMLENIHDIAPGAGLAFATADGGEVGFANNIRALATAAHAKVIVDDVGYLDEPMFQDGIIVAGGQRRRRPERRDLLQRRRQRGRHGYQSQFRGRQRHGRASARPPAAT